MCFKSFMVSARALCLILLLFASGQQLFGHEKDSTLAAAGQGQNSTELYRIFPVGTGYTERNFSLHSSESELTEAYLKQYIGEDGDAAFSREQAKAAIDKLNELGTFVTSLTSDKLHELPIGFKKVVNSTVITIAISEVKFKPGYAEFTAFAKLDIPQEPRELYFGLQGIKLTYEGGIVGDARLVLLGDIPIRFNGGASVLILKGSSNTKVAAPESKTYLSFDCNGFKEVGIAADIEFPRSLLIPVDPNGKRYESADKRVKGSFTTVVTDWNDILVEFTLPDFEMPLIKDMRFSIETAVLDFSDLRNSPSVVYPEGYEAEYLEAGHTELWRGVYAKSIKIVLPEAFEDKTNPDKRISFIGADMLIDNNGLTGSFTGKNLLPIEKGTASGWKLSVDEMQIKLEANNLTGASFKGMLGLPIAEKDTFAYEAVMMPDEYLLKVSVRNKFSFSALNATVEIDPNSYVQLKLTDNKFRPEAMLHGRMSMKVSKNEDGSSAMGEFKGIEFKSLHIMTETPYIEVEYFGYKGELKFANFPVSINDIGLTAQGGKAKLGFNLKLNLMSGQFGATTRLEVKSKLEKREDGTQSWKYDGIGISAIQIKATISGSLEIEGALSILDDDPIYGDGIAGQLQAKFIPVKVEVKAKAMFGSTTYRYWYVEGSVSYGDGIPVVGPLRIHGFGGGAYYHMKRQAKGVVAGSALTTMDYTPDDKIHFGIKAAVLFNVATRSVVDGEASFEIGFTKSYGISYIGFFGDARFIGKIPGTENIEGFVTEQQANFAKYEDAFVKDNPLLAQTLETLKVNEPSQAAAALLGDAKKMGESGMISAHVGMMMDFTNKSFHSTFDVYVNVAGGLLRGIGNNNRAGWSVMHIDSDSWYIYMGTPVDRMGIQFGIGSFSVKTGGYFMAGSKVLDSPPPPTIIADMLGVEMAKLDYMRDANALEDGRGFAFGTNFSVDTGEMRSFILYASFKAGAGFDIMLRDYGDAHCAGQTEPIGIGGWYANGQAYAYMQGEVGVKIKIFGMSKKFSVLRGGSAVLLQARLPNPTMFKGYLAVKVDILGGLVSGNFRLKVALGKDCEIVNDSGSPLALNVIADLKPIDKTKDVDVFAAPQAAFNMRMEHPFYVEDDDGSKSYRIKLEEFTVTDNGTAIAGKLEWNKNRDLVTFYSTETLPPHKELKAVVKVSFELQQGSTWQQVYEEGKKAMEFKEITFTTGDAPDNIPLSNIEYAYPVVDQRNYYRDESKEGYIQLKRGQSYLFSDAWRYEIVNGKTGQASKKQEVVYNATEKRIDFALDVLDLNAAYTIGMVATPRDAASTQQGAVEQVIKNDAGDLTIRQNQASEVQQTDLGKSLIEYSFHTSKHALYSDKIKSITIVQPLIGKISSDVISLQPQVATYEGFDVVELIGTQYSNHRALSVVAALPQDAYYRQDIYPLLYQEYPIANEIRLHRDTAALGFYPSRALPIMSLYQMQAELSESTGITTTRVPYIYNLPDVYHQDFIDLQTQVVNTFLGTEQQNRYASIIMGGYPMIRAGNYPVKFQYILPNGKRGSSAIFTYTNPIK